jgi:hypothetical protein
MTSINKTARTAGLLYLMLVISGIISLIYIPSKLIVRQNAAQTFENILNNEVLFKFGIVSGITTFLIFLPLPLVLYKLLHKVDETCAKLMVLFALISIPISFTNILHKFSVLSLIEKGAYLQQMEMAELQTQVMLQLA